ncbi:Piso0_000742 [Millerozyma farinosa CBS 7064]|uniref:Piso0_000742 protein n=1 Tax=Pichia sorbitophila (strain ATCC MYA-4447 / BCRC 22081 / CBS 7064 / NBRC 10061 / NRRL Y-12695) TaxID=559304 RepID=G8YRE0_PICSO|nr:Piso0_000742 [Millerozyma farinosa CBS 7064]
MTIRHRKPNKDDTSEEDGVSGIRRLFYFHELDAWQQDNHFIKSGYLKETSSFKECLNSLLYLHNETVNIHSHLLPSALVMGGILYYVNYQLRIYENYLGVWEKLNFIQFGTAATLCLFMSATFHCIKCHSHKVCKFGNQLDYFGIVILITCSLISIILFAFYDEPFSKYLYSGLFLSLGSVCTVLTLKPKFATSEYRSFRATMFIIFGLSGIFPIISAISLYGFENAVQRSSAGWLVFEGFFYISGAVLYACRFPERLTHNEEDIFTPGLFDIFGHSHQIFHVFVVIAVYCHWRALTACYHYLHNYVLTNAL